MIWKKLTVLTPLPHTHFFELECSYGLKLQSLKLKNISGFQKIFPQVGETHKNNVTCSLNSIFSWFLQSRNYVFFISDKFPSIRKISPPAREQNSPSWNTVRFFGLTNPRGHWSLSTCGPVLQHPPKNPGESPWWLIGLITKIGCPLTGLIEAEHGTDATEVK